MNRCGKMRMAQLRKLYKDLGKGIRENHHVSDSRCESVEDTLHEEVFFALFWAVLVPLHQMEIDIIV